MADLLLLYLDGPLQSWGTSAQWDVRGTDDEPSKSGVIGLLGCALGYGVGDPRLADLSRALRMGVRVDRPGMRMIDYHTTTGILRNADGGFSGSDHDPYTIVSYRSYLVDATFLVALEGPLDILTNCAQALQNPKWPVYLGRKACIPCRPVFEALTNDYASIEEAFAMHPWYRRTEIEKVPETLRCVIEDPQGDRWRRDEVTMRPGRVYDERAVRVVARLKLKAEAL